MNLLESPITLALLVLNVFVSGYVFFVDPASIERLSFKPRAIVDRKEYYRFLTAGFVHGGFGHLFMNMLTLYFFGPQLEGVLGPVRFLLLYFGSEMAAHALTFHYHKNDVNYSAVGASGAISGVVFAFCLFAPFAMLGIMFFIPMPAILFAVLYVYGSIYMMKQARLQGQPGIMGRIAHEAHLGGAIGGLLLTIILEPRSVMIFLNEVMSVIR
ncbi:MAG: rhomboid family intramembrane serine protease [Rhodothermales bacterium]|nr:rhomboid family intramembrane serine protease [Rhodothermales bacterium]